MRVTLTAETGPLVYKLCNTLIRQPEEVIYLAVSFYAALWLPKADPAKAAPKGRGGPPTTLPVKATMTNLLRKSKKGDDHA